MGARKRIELKAEPASKDAEFQQVCESLRKAKIELKRAQDAEKQLKEQLKDLVIAGKISKGEYFGVKIMEKYTFLPSNVELAKSKGIEVPMDKSIHLKMSDSRINEMIKANILHEDEIERIEQPNLKELKKKFEELEIEAEFSLDYSFGLSNE